MKTQTISVYVILLLLIGWSCIDEMANESDLRLDEIVYGTWERRAVLDPLSPGGYSWQDQSPPYLTYTFDEDNTYRMFVDTFVIQTGTFEVSNTDTSIYSVESSSGHFDLQVDYFTRDSFVTISPTIEGAFKARFVRR